MFSYDDQLDSQLEMASEITTDENVVDDLHEQDVESTEIFAQTGYKVERVKGFLKLKR